MKKTNKNTNYGVFVGVFGLFELIQDNHFSRGPCKTKKRPTLGVGLLY
jgi:hypothetical protein